VPDISVILKTVADQTHDARATLGVLQELTRATGIDWDEWAGEAWARLLRDDEVIALLHRRMPLAFVLDAYSDAPASRIHMIAVSSFSAPMLSASSASLQMAFPNDQFTEEFHPHSFSVNELWWETV